MFRDDFVWGVASSAYQIEGRDPEDGAGKMIWDTFAENGHIQDRRDASVTCDHMHRYKEDYAMMRLLGIKAHRFSVSWARLIPEGKGAVNEKAVAMYRDMILEMRKNGIEPYLTLYHWELPQALQDKGGWLNEEIISWFGEYAKAVAENFSDICGYYFTLNEPQCFVGLGYLAGEHAPGLKLSVKETFQVAHNALRAHGQAVINLRKYALKPVKIGYAPTCSMAFPASEKPEDIEAARKTLFSFSMPIENWTWNVAWFSDPVFLGHYPEEGLEKFKEYLPEITREDMELIAQPLDFMGQNIYNGYAIRAGENGEPEDVEREQGSPKTAAGWPVTPECLYWGVKFLYERYRMPLYITENGMSCHDIVSADGRVHDSNRIEFLDRYLSALQRAGDDGADIRGYFLWTFLDNFEWNKGYTERFGIVHVDFATGKRIIKDSAYWYQHVIETNGAALAHKPGSGEILFIEPVFKQMVWGGKRLGEEWPYRIPGNDTGECWISGNPNDKCYIREGRYKGITLSELYKKHPELFGNIDMERFPIMVKIIAAEKDLSVQVHPDDDYAKRVGDGSYGKTESWYVLECKEDSKMIVGHNAKDREELKHMIGEGRWDSLIRKIPIHKGDFIHIAPGILHAIEAGTVVLETQQNSDLTYRIYDYDRLVDGKPRALHIDKGMEVINVPSKNIEDCVKSTADLSENQIHMLLDCPHYRVYKLRLTQPLDLMMQEHPFLLCSVTKGDGLINGQFIRKGDHFILPHGFGPAKLQGDLEMIISVTGSACKSK